MIITEELKTSVFEFKIGLAGATGLADVLKNVSKLKVLYLKRQLQTVLWLLLVD